MVERQRGQPDAVVNSPLASGLARFFYHRRINQPDRLPFQRQALDSRRFPSIIADTIAAAILRTAATDSIVSQSETSAIPADFA